VKGPDEVLAVYVKEMKALARDRHTILYSFCLPLFLYPALVWGVIQVLTYLRALDETIPSRVILVAPPGESFEEGTAAAFRASLGEKHRIEISSPPLLGPVSGGEARPGWFGAGLSPRLQGPSGPAGLEPRTVARSWIRDGDTEAVVFLDAPQPGTAFQARVFHDGASEASRRAKKRIEEALEEHRLRLLQASARAAGEEDAFLEALAVEETDVSTRQELAKYIASLILPLLMIVMTALGAFYPALDATVGEKERGTLETTLLSPIGRTSIVLGKYLAVVTFSFLSFFLNFLSMMLTLSHLRSQLKLEGFSIGGGSTAVILAAAILLAFFLGAIMMALGFLARTFKEGQSYVTPVYLFSVFPVIATSSPDIALTPLLSIVPVVNVSLLFREALQGRLPVLGVTLTFAASLFYALLALAAAARLLRREEYRTGAVFGPRAAIAWLFGATGRGP
jgi:ABC-type Na+ efflux pump permease subunit